MKQGFTLMEVLAVLLVIAVVASLTAPVFRAARYEIKHSQAKLALKKLHEAKQRYYQMSRGVAIEACFSGADTDVISAAPSTCSDPGATGIPAKYYSRRARNSANDLFACGLLEAKDFAGLPYQFCTYRSSEIPSLVSDLSHTFAYGLEGAGAKYQLNKGFLYIFHNEPVKDTYEQ